jgi:hypothetical protein
MTATSQPRLRYGHRHSTRYSPFVLLRLAARNRYRLAVLLPCGHALRGLGLAYRGQASSPVRFTWWCLACFLGYGKQWLSFRNRALDYLSEASYPLLPLWKRLRTIRLIVWHLVHVVAELGQFVIHAFAGATLIAQGAMFWNAVPGVEGQASSEGDLFW